MSKIAITVVSMMVSMCFFVGDAKAQFMLGVKGEITSFPGIGGCHAGGAVVVGKQMKAASVQADFGYSPSTVRCDLLFMLRMYGNTNHTANVYLGAGVSGGMNLETDNKAFMPGVFPVIQAETFVTGRLSLYADVRVPYLFLVEKGWGTARCSLGLRYLFGREDGNE